MSWIDNELGYIIFRSEDGLTYERYAMAATDAQTYTDKNTTQGINYYYRVSAFNANGYSELSTPATITSLYD